MFDMEKREYVALQILMGACAGDWKFDIPQGMKWDEVAVLRSFQIADAFLNPVPIAESPAPKKAKKPRNEEV